MRLVVFLAGLMFVYSLDVFANSYDFKWRDGINESGQKPDQFEIRQVVQVALETRVSGKSEVTKYHSGIKVKVTPIATWKSKTNHFCRSYLLEIFGDGRLKYSQRHVACRNKNGGWNTVS